MMKVKYHTNGLPYVEDGSGHRRVLGCLAADPKKFAHLPRFADSFPTLPRSQWKECQDDDSDLPILDQNGHGSCVGHGSCSAFQHVWNKSGFGPQRFSPCFLYGLINGGSDNGAVVGDAMDALMQKGICLETTVPEGNQIYQSQFPQTAFTEAQRFKLERAYRVSSFDEIATAVQMGFAVSTGVDIGRAFEPDAQGVLPDLRGSSGGHCTCQRRGLKNIGGKWYLFSQNSWGTSWGLQGRFWIPESYFQGQTDHFVPAFDSFDPQDKIKPPAGS